MIQFVLAGCASHVAEESGGGGKNKKKSEALRHYRTLI